MKLTDAQLWALRIVAAGLAVSPAALGDEMMKRPMAVGTNIHTRQGLGRLGGAMMARLDDMGLVHRTYQGRAGWHPARAHLTPLGLQVLTEHRGP